MRTQALLIGGRSGVGKSTVGYEIHEQLAAADIRHGLIEGDNLDQAHPPPWEHGLAERNLAAMWGNYRELGYHRLIYTNTASVFDKVQAELIAAMGDSPEVTAVLLTCSAETARERLGRREIGTRLEQQVEHSAAMARRLERAAAPSVHRVATDGRDIAAIAREIIELTGWQTA